MMYALGLFSKKQSQMLTVKWFHEVITSFPFPNGHKHGQADRIAYFDGWRVNCGITGLKLPLARREIPSASMVCFRGHM